MRFVHRILALVIGLFCFPYVAANVKAISAFESNQLDTAKQLFLQQIESGGEDAMSFHYLAKIALRNGDLDVAEEQIEKAAAIAPDSDLIQYEVARVMSHQAMNASIFSVTGYAKKALIAYKAAAKLRPDIIRYRQSLMNFYLKAPGMLGGDLELAKAEAKAIAELDEAQGELAIIDIKLNSGELTDEAGMYSAALTKFPNNVHILLRRGKLYQSKEKFSLAADDFRKVSKLKLGDNIEVLRLTALYEHGRNSVLSQNNLEEGLSALQLFLADYVYHEKLPTRPWAKYQLGQLLLIQGKSESAQTLFIEAKNTTTDSELIKLLKTELKKV